VYKRLVVLRASSAHVVRLRGGIADRLHAWLARASKPGLTGERRAVLQGVVLGEDGGLSDTLRQRFRASGLYHLLAVSGGNVLIVAGGTVTIAFLLGVSRLGAELAALASIGAYVLAVGPQPSVIRAAIAGAAVSVAWLAGRLRDAWHLLLVAACALLAWNPYSLFDAGFQLSFGAVAAIFVLGGPFLRVLDGYPMPGWLRSALAISAACTLVTAPILWLEFGRVPLYGVIANALVEPAVPLLLGLSFSAAAAAPFAPGVAVALAWANGWVAVYIETCARAVSALPAAQVSGRAAAAAAAAAIGGVAISWRRLRRIARA
jgi:competence protein ComEC